MKKNLIVFLLFLCAALYGQVEISCQEYQSRIARLSALLDTTSMLAMKATEMHQRTNDVGYPYRQESNFLYITGATEPSCYFVLVPKGMIVGEKKVCSILFLPKDASLPNAGCDTILDPAVFQLLFRQAVGSITTDSTSTSDPSSLSLGLPDCSMAHSRLAASARSSNSTEPVRRSR